MGKKLPDNFQPDDKTYLWALHKHGYHDLPDMFLSDFRQIHAANGSKFENWQKALKMHVNRNSPSGIYHTPRIWETAIEKCKQRMNEEKAKVPIPKMKTTPKKRDKKIARDEIKRMLEALG